MVGCNVHEYCERHPDKCSMNPEVRWQVVPYASRLLHSKCRQPLKKYATTTCDEMADEVLGKPADSAARREEVVADEVLNWIPAVGEKSDL